MSTTISTILNKSTGNELSITEFYGGVNRGICLQLTRKEGYIQLERDEVDALVVELIKWLDKHGD